MAAEQQRDEAQDVHDRVKTLKEDTAVRKRSAREHIEQTRQRLARGVDRDGLDDGEPRGG